MLPTLITLWLLTWAWEFLWNSIGVYIIRAFTRVYETSGTVRVLPTQRPEYLAWAWREELFATRLIGVILAIILVYLVGVVLGNFIGHTAWRLAEFVVIRVPLIRAIYPAVKQVTDFLLSDRSGQFRGSRVVAVRPHEGNIWSIGLVTGPGVAALNASSGEEMVTVFIPSSPTAFSGYVVVVPRSGVVDLPIPVDDAMRMLVSGGVIQPVPTKSAPAISTGDLPQAPS